MADNIVKFVDVVPGPMTHPPLASGAGHVARKIKREFLPTAQVDYKYDKNDEIEFHVSSSKDFLVPSETYIRCTLSTTGTLFDGSTVNDFNRTLEEGGLHNMFRRVEITDTAGRQIDMIDDYDRLANIISNIYHSKDHIQSHEFQSGDFDLGESKNNVDAGSWYPLDFNVAAISALGVVTVTTGPDVRLVIEPGDQVALFPVGEHVPTHVSKVLSVTDSTTFTINYTPSISSANLRVFKYLTPGQLAAQPERDPRNDAKTVDLNIRLSAGLFSMQEDLPLFLMDGLVIKLFLREPRFALRSGHSALGTPAKAPFTLDYTISKPRLIGTLRTPSEEVRSEYMSLYQRGNLNYVFPAFHHISRQESGIESSSIELDLPVAKSSVRRVVFIVQNENARGNLNTTNRLQNTYAYANKTFIDGRIIDYQFKVGGVDYPQLRVDCSDIFMTEAYNELMRAWELHGNLSSAPRLSWDKWAKTHISSSTSFPNDAEYYLESKKALFATSFATVENDPMSGLKTKGIGTDNHVICRINVSGPNLINKVASTRYFDFYFEYSKILHLSQTGILVLD